MFYTILCEAPVKGAISRIYSSQLTILKKEAIKVIFYQRSVVHTLQYRSMEAEEVELTEGGVTEYVTFNWILKEKARP